ncbi:hypothetical protein S245_034457 [Arachis hypogaea]
MQQPIPTLEPSFSQERWGIQLASTIIDSTTFVPNNSSSIDINNAFLNDDLDEEVYMKLSLGHPQRKQGLVCKLTRSLLYGLRQASRQWFTKFCNTLTNHSFKQSKQDYSLFAFGEGDSITFLIVYMDDIIIAFSKQEMVEDVK